MKTVYHYKGFWNCDAKCGLEIKKDGDKFTVILTELKDNPGTSVTNYIEHLATLVYQQFLGNIPVENITWVEHYPSSGLREETYDKVIMEWNGIKFSNPKWSRVAGREVKNV